DPMTKGAPSRTNQLLVALWFVEGSALLLALALYKRGNHPLAAFVRSPAGAELIAAAIALAASALWVGLVARADRAQIAPSLALNLASIALAAGAAELAIRLFAVETPEGPTFANTRLLPRSWDATA